MAFDANQASHLAVAVCAGGAVPLNPEDAEFAGDAEMGDVWTYAVIVIAGLHPATFRGNYV